MANHSEQKKDIRVASTQKIWSYATGMLALCLIFAPARNGVILPLSVVLGAAGSTTYVWRSAQKSQESLHPNQMQQIEERLANLETIAASNDWNLQMRIKQLESSQDKVST